MASLKLHDKVRYIGTEASLHPEVYKIGRVMALSSGEPLLVRVDYLNQISIMTEEKNLLRLEPLKVDDKVCYIGPSNIHSGKIGEVNELGMTYRFQTTARIGPVIEVGIVSVEYDNGEIYRAYEDHYRFITMDYKVNDMVRFVNGVSDWINKIGKVVKIDDTNGIGVDLSTPTHGNILWCHPLNLELVTSSNTTTTCPDCKGSSEYIGLSVKTKCKKCKGTGAV